MSANNNLTGTLPEELALIPSLRSLRVNTFMSEWYDYVPPNEIFGTIPPIFGDALHLLREFDAGENQLTGTIPPELGNLRSLQNLDLGGNRLTRTIPTSLDTISTLQKVSLSHNHLKGTMPGDGSC